MADITLVKISALPAAEQIGAEDLLPVVQEGATKAVTYGVIKEDIAEELAPDATLSEAGKAADAKAVGDALALKADVTTVTAEVNRIDAALATKANTNDVNAALALKADSTDVTDGLSLKADKTEVAADLALKADKTELTAGLATKQNVLTFDSTPTQGSMNPVTSGGIHSAIPSLDNTLTRQGEAAEASATGAAIAKVKDELSKVESDLYENVTPNYNWVIGGINSAGTYNSSYKYSIRPAPGLPQIPVDGIISCDSGYELRVVRYSSKTATASTFVSDSGWTTTPQAVTKGEFVAPQIRYYKNTSVVLEDTSISEHLIFDLFAVKTPYPVNKVKYGADNTLYIAAKVDYGYIVYDFNRYTNAEKNADGWGIYLAYLYDNGLNFVKNVTASGEWECAVHLKDRPDFSGLRAHGSEVYTDIKFLIDGVYYDESTISGLTDWKTCGTVSIYETSQLYDPNDETTVIAEHWKKYTWKGDELVIEQKITWAINDETVMCYLAMLPIAKAVTNYLIDNTNFVYNDLSTESHYSSNDCDSITIFDTSAQAVNICATFGVAKNEANGTPYKGFTLTDNGGTTYNKCYFHIGTYKTITAGEVWKAEAHYVWAAGTN